MAAVIQAQATTIYKWTFAFCRCERSARIQTQNSKEKQNNSSLQLGDFYIRAFANELLVFIERSFLLTLIAFLFFFCFLFQSTFHTKEQKKIPYNFLWKNFYNPCNLLFSTINIQPTHFTFTTMNWTWFILSFHKRNFTKLDAKLMLWFPISTEMENVTEHLHHCSGIGATEQVQPEKLITFIRSRNNKDIQQRWFICI